MARTVIEEHEPQRLRDEITRQFPRTEDAWLGLEWLIARRPDSGTEIGLGPNVRLHKQQEVAIAGVPMITVLYKYDDNCVRILEAKFDSIHETEILDKTGSEDA
jgi:hypothetical protein